ncbi:MlaE family ABC transporter permease [Hymenobacter convexus]|uniref:MlaE family ABC transporter permease n=1 Tax=Hymenobacter sp. CA1UV-4 TaxID=3063782 RepID=UPI002712304A|nr:ABC transporter permease [Hymenobacter sp. CA1UV-4]MDO7852470.1 ABC transporter permease [Hymenobacter sp. CA1UV-4]
MNDNSLLPQTGLLTRFAGRFFREAFRGAFEWGELVRQCFAVGYQSLLLVGITAFIMGLVITMRLRPVMVQFGAESWIPSMVGISIIREMGPLITGLMVAGKVSSNIGAELGSMRVTEQIDAMEVSGANPFKYLVVTRVVAATLMVPVLSVLADGFSLTGAYLGISLHGDTTVELFASDILKKLTVGHVLEALVKSVFFGFAIGLIGCYKGYYAVEGTEGVGRAANSAVVVASLVVFVLDLLTVQVSTILGIN